MAFEVAKFTDYSANISTAFNDLLKQNDLVDVTLVAEDYMFNAHRLVLSALSPYFRRIFTQMPVNQQAFGKYQHLFMHIFLLKKKTLYFFFAIRSLSVFLTGVSKQSLDDLLQYIYNGHVNIKEDNSETFLKTAEAFGIKGFENQSNFGKSSSIRFESNRPLNASQYESIDVDKRKLVTHSRHRNENSIPTPNWVPSQYQSIGINKRKSVIHSGHRNKSGIPTPNWAPPSLVMNRSEHDESNDSKDSFAMPESSNNDQLFNDNQLKSQDIPLEDLNVFDDRNTQLPVIKREKRAKRSKRNGNQGLLTAKKDDQPEDRKEGQPAAKRLKRAKQIGMEMTFMVKGIRSIIIIISFLNLICTEFADFDIVADVRKDADGRENLYHQNQKFCRHSKASTSVSSRWVCTKNRSERCRAIIKTADVDGVTMMCVVRAEHTH